MVLRFLFARESSSLDPSRDGAWQPVASVVARCPALHRGGRRFDARRPPSTTLSPPPQAAARAGSRPTRD
eukprot:8278368-Lingulodinium_polyedra.AAC.1